MESFEFNRAFNFRELCLGLVEVLMVKLCGLKLTCKTRNTNPVISSVDGPTAPEIEMILPESLSRRELCTASRCFHNVRFDAESGRWKTNREAQDSQ